MTAAPAPAPTRSLNLIDAIVTAGRLYGAYASTVIGFSLVLQGIKVAAMFLAHLMFGKVGYEFGGQITTVLLVINGGVCARLAFDAQAGVPPAGPRALVERSRPFLSGLVLLGGFYLLALGALYLVFSAALWATGVDLSYDVVIMPGFVLVAFWAIAAAALVADALTPDEALRMSWKLIRPALAFALLFVVFQWFVLRLIPALADSAVGRHAPLAQWWTAEALVSAVISPLLALTTATFFLALYERRGAAALESIRPPVADQPAAPGPVFVHDAPQVPVFSHPAPPAVGGPEFVARVPVERLRHLPVGYDRAVVRRLQWQYGLFWLAPGAVFLMALMAAPFIEDEQVGRALPELALALDLLAQTWLARRILLPFVRELQARSAGGVRAEAVVRVVRYRPWWSIIGIRLQMLRYCLADGTVVEAGSQSRNRRLKSGQVVIARYDPSEPLWVILENAPLEPLVRRLNVFAIGLPIAAVVMAIVGLTSLL